MICLGWHVHCTDRADICVDIVGVVSYGVADLSWRMFGDYGKDFAAVSTCRLLFAGNVSQYSLYTSLMLTKSC